MDTKQRATDRAATVAVLGAFDTKGVELGYLSDLIRQRGLKVLVIDTSVVGPGSPDADIAPAEVARAGGVELDQLLRERDRGAAVAVMAKGAAAVVARAWDEGAFDAIIAAGGGAGTLIGTTAMRGLPFGVPKLMVSTLASGDTSIYIGGSDIVMIPSVADVAGLNRITRRVFGNAAAAVCGMAISSREYVEAPSAGSRPLVAATMFGNTTRAVDHARRLLEAEGYEVLVFHATGVGGAAMENLIHAGMFAGVLDLTTTELADELCGGVLSAGASRLRAAAETGTPQVVAPGCLDMVNFWSVDSVPERFADRTLYSWNPQVTLMRTTPDETRQLAAVIAERLNVACGPTAFLIPTRGWSELDVEGGRFWWPEAVDAFVESLRSELRPDIPVTTLDVDVNDPAFADAMARTLIALIDGQGTQDPVTPMDEETTSEQ